MWYLVIHGRTAMRFPSKEDAEAFAKRLDKAFTGLWSIVKLAKRVPVATRIHPVPA